MKDFTDQDVFNYPLTPDSVIMDVGCHDGNFAEIMFTKYGCRIECYEPVPEFYNLCVRRFAGRPKIRLWPFGLGAADAAVAFGVKGVMSGIFCTSPNNVIEVPIRDVADVRKFLPERVALLSLNVEGHEYAILERLLDAGEPGQLIRSFDNISVQFHTTAPNYAERLALIKARMSFSHELMYDAPFCWTGWSIRK